jgi:hypothetical protein
VPSWAEAPAVSTGQHDEITRRHAAGEEGDTAQLEPPPVIAHMIDEYLLIDTTPTVTFCH